MRDLLKKVIYKGGGTNKTMTKTIPFAKNYEIDSDLNVYNRGRPVKLTQKSGTKYASIYCDDGTRRFIKATRLAEEAFGEPQRVLTPEIVLGTLKARRIENWPRYAVTNYGAVYCIVPPTRGKGAKGCFLVKERMIRKTPYVSLYDHGGHRKTIKVSDLVSSAWNY